MRHRFLIAGALLAALALFAPGLAGAADEFLFEAPSAVPSDLTSLGPALSKIWTVIVAVAGIVFLVMILIGGIMYLSSAGNEDGTKKARTLMLDAFIGLILTLGAWAIGTFILNILGGGKLLQIENTATGTNDAALDAATASVPTAPGTTVPASVLVAAGTNPVKDAEIRAQCKDQAEVSQTVNKFGLFDFGAINGATCVVRIHLPARTIPAANPRPAATEMLNVAVSGGQLTIRSVSIDSPAIDVSVTQNQTRLQAMVDESKF